MPTVLTANRLDNGQVVYLTSKGDWSPRLDAARIGVCEDDVLDLTRLAAANGFERDVVDVYAMVVDLEQRLPQPLSMRERIRARGGPSPEGLRQTEGR